MILSVNAEKYFDKIQHSLMIKTFQMVGIEGIYLNIIKVIYDKSKINIVLTREKLEAFPLRLERREGCALPPLFFNEISEVLVTEIRQERSK